MGKITIPDFDSVMLRNYRNALMGISIIYVIIFHFHPKGLLLNNIGKYGWTGVDMFFYLSAIGLCYSLNSKSNILQFYRRRISRIIPTWWFFLISVLAISIIVGKLHPSGIFEFLCYFTGLGWWLNGLFDNALFVYYYEWYVPTLLFYYAIFPFFFFMSRRTLLFLTIIVSIGIEIMLRDNLCPSLHLSYPRLLSFMIGILSFRYIFENSSKNKRIDHVNYILFFISITSVLLAISHQISFNVFLSFIMPFVFYIFAIIIKYTKSSKLFSFLGSISLELYLVHIYWQLPTINLGGIVVDGDLLLIPKILVCIIIALMLKYTVEIINKMVLRDWLT